jgi:hypothetical protein
MIKEHFIILVEEEKNIVENGSRCEGKGKYKDIYRNSLMEEFFFSVQ